MKNVTIEEESTTSFAGCVASSKGLIVLRIETEDGDSVSVTMTPEDAMKLGDTIISHAEEQLENERYSVKG